MTTLLPKHGPHIVLQRGSSWILTNVRRDAPCQISLCFLNPVTPFPWNGQKMALLWPKYGAHMVLQVGSSWILVIVPRYVQCQSSHCWVYLVASFQEMAKIWPFVAKTWSSHGPSNRFFLSLNHCAQGCSMPNFTLLGLYYSPLS